MKTMCRVLNVSTSGYYAWCKRQPSERTQADQKLCQRIHEIHEKSKGTYGAPRIHAELADVDELHVGRKRVARLMRAEGLQGVSRRKAPHTTRRQPGRVLPPIWSNEISAPRFPTVCGSQTLPTSQLGQVGCTWPLSWMPGAAKSSVGRCLLTCRLPW
jgi:transposase InsO family protein